jgi:hypothetical protein
VRIVQHPDTRCAAGAARVERARGLFSCVSLESMRGPIVAQRGGMLKKILLSASCLLPIVSACKADLGDSTYGQQDKVSFAYNSCFFGCAVDRAMATGTNEGLTLTAVDGDHPVITAETDNPEVAEVIKLTHSCCAKTANNESCTTWVDPNQACGDGQTGSGSLTLIAVGPGVTQLVLKNKGVIYDTLTVHVEDATRVSATCQGAGSTSEIDVAMNDTCKVAAHAYGASGDELQASTGIQGTFSSPTIAAFQHVFGGDTESTTLGTGLDTATIHGRAAGTSTLTVASGRAHADVVVRVR